MFSWNSDDRRERFIQLKEFFKKIDFSIMIDDNVKLYGVDKKHKQIFLGENLINSEDCKIINQMIKEVCGKKFLKEIEIEK